VKSPGLDSGFATLVAFALLAVGLFSRRNALAVQDRVIRLEEQGRMRRMLPADMHDNIESFTAEQMVGLRFASDGEYVDLVKAVVTEGITDRAEIKKRIKSWRPDFQRV
jgi:hypothetical protein